MNLFERIKNKALDNKVVVIMVFSFILITGAAAFKDSIYKLLNIDPILNQASIGFIQEGDSGVLSKGIHKVYYPIPYKFSPSLKIWHIKSNGEFGDNYIDFRTYKKLKEEPDGFVIEVPSGYTVGYKATGIAVKI